MFMMKKLPALFYVALSFLTLPIAEAQDYNIKDDTIRVSSSAYPMLSFMGEIQEANPLCSDYKLITSTTTLTIRPATSKPVKVCRLIVSEGSKKSPRQHQFVLLFDKDADPSEQIHDYSTKELMEKRIAYLEKMREANPGGAKPEDEDESPKKSKKKKHRNEDKQDEEKPKEKEVAREETKTTERETKTNEGANAASADESADAYTIKDIPEEQLKGRVKQKINAFYRTCENLCAKIDVDGTIKYGMKLFDNNEDVIVATTNSKTNSSRPQKIRQYFIHLSQLSYKKVVMTASEIKFVSNFHKGPDGKWHASAVIIQDFKGYKDYDILAYKDQTSKTVDIIIALIEEVKEGKTVRKFDIFLGNISVTNVPS
jgi:hypothetical protein